MTDVQLALSYAAAGIPVFPCRQVDEPTDDYDPDTGEQIVLKAKTPLVSNGFKGASLNERVINILWQRNPGAMVGIPTGEQLGAWVLDVDMHEDENGNVQDGYKALAALEAKHSKLPDTATAKTAGGGEHRYFRHVPGVRNRQKGGDSALPSGIDIRGSGGYVIAPGSKTADGRAYEWVGWSGDGLPPITDAPDWLLEIVTPKKVAPSQYAPSGIRGNGDNPTYVARAVEAELDTLASAGAGNRNNQLNDSAYALGQFVGAGALDENEARGELEAIAKQWPNFPKSKGTIARALRDGAAQPRVIPAPEYVQDNTPKVDTSPMIARGLEKAEKAKRGLAKEADDKLSEECIQTSDTNTAAVSVQTDASEDDDDGPDYKLDAIADLEALTYPGGLVEDMVDWIVSSAEQPCRTLALAAALPLVAALAGPRFSTGGRDTRPNIYIVALAESGFGKEHARSQIKRLLMASQKVFERYSGPARIMSASALREVLEANQSVNCQIDEFGGFVRDITDRKAGSHQRAISTDLRDYYSASSTYFEGAAYRGSPPKRIYNPNLCIHGTSTPEQFWTALSSASAEDGLLPRLVLFHVTGGIPATVTPQRDVRWTPHDILMKMADVAGIDVAKTRSVISNVKMAAFAENKPYVVPWTPDALGIFASIKETIERDSRRVKPEMRPFMQRILENAVKLALIVAVGINPEKPEIGEATIEWAATLAWTCAASMMAEVEERLSDNQREANYKRIAALIRTAGKKGITRGRLADRVKAIDARQRDEILKDLAASGKVMESEIETAGRTSRRLIWL